MFDLEIPLFPTGSLDSSVITTTLVGVWVVAFFNLRFGWVLSGLVVPGYLVPLVIMKPWSAAVIGVEALVTYIIVYILSEKASRLGLWSSFFGRDRFFALILTSIAVRVGFDGYFLPAFGSYLEETYNLAFNYRNSLHSFGLIIVALIANQFWKSGFFRGIGPVLTVIFTTWVVVRFGLMEWTNFRISDIGYLYEDLAGSILSSPKAYIILVITAFMASRMNLKYGWDFNGILIPALLALQWYEPLKILASVVEAMVIYVMAVVVLRLPPFNQMTIEGARKLVLFFTLSFIYKIVLSHGIPYISPTAKISDYFGFGYLLSTLIAIKVHDKDILGRLVRATLQTSLSGVVVASIIGFIMVVALPLEWQGGSASIKAVADVNELPPYKTLDDVVNGEKVHLYRRGTQAPVPIPTPSEQAGFLRALIQIKSLSKAADLSADFLMDLKQNLVQAGYGLLELEGGYLALIENGKGQGWGTLIFNPNSSNTLGVELPEPFERQGLMNGSQAIFEALKARYLLMSGVSGRRAADKNATPLKSPSGFYNLAHRELMGTNALIVRGFTSQTLAWMEERKLRVDEVRLPDREPIVWAKRSLPPDLSLTELEGITEKANVYFGTAKGATQQIKSSWKGVAEVYLSKPALRSLTFAKLSQQAKATQHQVSVDWETYIEGLFFDKRDDMPGIRTNLYVMPTLAELYYWDEEILTPLMTLYKKQDVSKAQLDDELKTINFAAQAFGYRLDRFSKEKDEETFLLLHEPDPKLHWGSLLVKLGGGGRWMVQVPRPLFESQTLEMGLRLFNETDASFFFMSGAHNFANDDASSNVLSRTHARNIFSLVNQVFQREFNHTGALSVQVRGMGNAPEGLQRDKDIVLSSYSARQGHAPLSREFEKRLKTTLSFDVGILDESNPALAGLGAFNVFQAKYIEQTQSGEYAITWLSKDLRKSFRLIGDVASALAPFHDLGIETEELPIPQLVQKYGTDGFESFLSIDDILAYLEYGDSATLFSFIKRLPDGYQAKRWVDDKTRETFLVILNAESRITLLINLSPYDLKSTAAIRLANLTREIVEKTAWITFEGEGK